MNATAQRELTLTRTFDAPRQRVWDAYTIPEQLAQWWGPEIFETPLDTITVDLRPGGEFRLTMVNKLDGSRYPSEMFFKEVLPPERLVYGWEMQTTGVAAGEVTITFTEENGRTRLTQHYVGEISDQMFPLMEQGTNEQLDKLVALLAG
jgi:uncharacterized protein YndB with AHSA1/START domain